MAINSQEQEQILNLIIGMFNATPGVDYMGEIETLYELLDSDISSLANRLAELTIFTSQFDELSDELIAEKILSHFNMVPTSTEGEYTYDLVLLLLENGKSVIEIITAAIEYLSGDEIDEMYEDVAKAFANKLEVAKYHTLTLELSSSELTELQNILSTITSEDTTVEDAMQELSTSDIATIASVSIPDGNYTYGGEINITVTFNDTIEINGLDSVLKLQIGEVEKDAQLHSYTSNTLNYKYTVEDGYYSADTTVGVSENGLVLNNMTIKDQNDLNADLTFEAIENSLAVISDLYPPQYSLYNAHYDSDTNMLTINGTGFNSILEYSEDATVDIVERVDLTKLIWDFNGDDDGTSDSILAFTASDIISIKVLSDNELSFVLSNDLALENDANFGLTNGADTLDILEGFLSDTAGNISVIASENDTLLSVDNNILGTNGTDRLYGTLNDDTIVGLEGRDHIYGKDGNDTINAGSGSDVISGGLGIDSLQGGDGDDTFIFSQNDSLPLFSASIGIDQIIDLNLDGGSEDLIDLDVEVVKVNTAVSGEVDQATFIEDMNSLLNVAINGFNITSPNDISVSLVNVTSGDLEEKEYLAVDYNANDIFDSDDLVIEITGATITSLTTSSFI